MKKIVLTLVLLCAFTAQAQPVTTQSIQDQEETVEAQNVSENATTTAKEADPVELTPEEEVKEITDDLQKEYSLRLKRKYLSYSLKDLEKRKKWVQKQINKNSGPKKATQRERFKVELEVIEDAIKRNQKLQNRK